jgi:hypothetical protein
VAFSKKAIYWKIQEKRQNIKNGQMTIKNNVIYIMKISDRILWPDPFEKVV